MDPEPAHLLLLVFLNVELWQILSLSLPLLILLLLLVGSALVSGSEVAYFSLQPSDIHSLENKSSETDKRVMELLEKPKTLLATILISNNLINVGIVILSSYILSNFIEETQDPLTFFLIQVIAITFLILLFGEILPKVYASRNALLFSKRMAGFLAIIVWLFRPLSTVLIRSGNLLDRGVRRGGGNNQEVLSVNDLSQALELTQESTSGIEEQRLLEGIVRFGNTNVKQIMTPRLDVIALEEKKTYQEVLQSIRDAGFSRIPVFQETFDQISGVLYIKDLLPHLDASEDFEWVKLQRPAFFVPEQKKIDDLLQEFRAKRIHMAVVVDEFGGTSGIVTLEDVIEEIVGDISDEFDVEELIFSKLDDNTYVFEGKTPLNDFYKVIDIIGNEFEEEKGEADTLAGFLLEIAGKFPELQEEIVFNQYRFTVEALDNRRIQRIKVFIDPEYQVDEN